MFWLYVPMFPTILNSACMVLERMLKAADPVRARFIVRDLSNVRLIFVVVSRFLSI